MSTVENHGPLTVLRLEHGKVNALDLDLVRALTAQLHDIAPARGLVLTGTERVFCAGVDLARLVANDLDYTEVFLTELDALFQTLFELDVPVVAALTGHAIAGGCLLAAACDYRVMGQGRIGVTEALVGLPVPPAGLEALRFTTGDRTAGLVLSGRTVESEQALAWGLIDEITTPERVLPRALEIAHQLTAGPAETFAAHKQMLRAPARDRMHQAATDHGPAVLDAWLAPEPRRHAAGYLAGLKTRQRSTGPGPWG
ncbi:enoyl-CoA hydratase/isomerase family protein [Kocuria rosea]|nr:enoyl-CoA hydratase/isomerase family protein [Kocuria rosea]